MTEELVHLTIEGKSVEVPKGSTVYQAAKKAGFDIPIFCYQDRMPPFGACRMCLVQVDHSPKLQASCTLEVREGMNVSIQSDDAVTAREQVLELLLINHPLDCPICDRAGECPLQDQAYKHGPGESRFHEEKRHFPKALPLGPVLMLDRERCIACARCTRFSEHISGDHALEFKERGYRTEVGTPHNGPAESKFIGNTIMLCPVGALTSQVYRFRARPWDNKPVKSTCTLCPVGCSLYLDSRDGQILRTRSFENREINDIWLCDKGWFGYEFSASEERLQTPWIKDNGEFREASWDEALSLIVEKLLHAKKSGKAAAFGGNPLTIEENYFFQKIFREGLNVHHVDHRIGMTFLTEEEEGLPSGMETSIEECEALDFILLCGIDLTEEFPLVWLRMRQAIHKGAKVLFLGHYAPEISPYFTKTILHAPGEEIIVLEKHTEEIKTLVESSKKGAVFVGQQYLATKNRAPILQQIESFQLPMNILEGRGNSCGAKLAGMHPEKGTKRGYNAAEVVKKSAEEGWDVLYVAGADPAKKFPKEEWKQARENLGFLIVQDLFLTETALQADVILPALSYVEKEGTFLNIAGNLQTLYPGKSLPENVWSDGQIFKELLKKMDLKEELSEALQEILKEKKIVSPKLHKKVLSKKSFKSFPKETLKATFGYRLFDHGVRMKKNPHVLSLAKMGHVVMNQEEGEKQGIVSGEWVFLENAEGRKIEVKVDLSPKIAPGTVYIPLGFDEIPAYEWGAQLMNGMPLKLSLIS